MKKIFTLILTLAACTFGSWAQTITTSQPLNKNVVLEDYTGIHCQYCPEGHVIAQQILDNNPGRAAAIAIHQGPYATPSGSEPDYRTPFGDALAGQTGLSGYPSGTVNRHVFLGGVTALGRGDWTWASNQTMSEPSPVNVGVTSDFDSITRNLTVHVELYYTANSNTGTNYINVALIQDHIFGPQTGGGAGNNYEHMHMLRYLVTDQWGDPVTPTTAGTLIEKDYNYTVPADYNGVPCVVSNCQVVAFVTESHQEIQSGDVVNAINGTNLYVGDFTISDSTMALGAPFVTNDFHLQANSDIPGTEPFVIKLVKDTPSDWEASITMGSQTSSDSLSVDLTQGTPSDLTLHVMPGGTPGFYSLTLEMRSVNNPNAPPKFFKVYELSNVNTLLVNADGDANATSFQQVYIDGLNAAGSMYNGVMSSTMFQKAWQAGILQNVQCVFYNVAWTFPAFTDPQAIALKAYINNGGHVFVAGQDIGWDIESGQSGSHGTTDTKDLYTNYFKADWIDDGTTANNKLIANTSDSIFGTVATSNVVDVNGGYMYPDQVAPLQNAIDVFYYNTALTKISALRSMKATAKVVYFGVGMEMVQSVPVRNDIIKKAWDWFGSPSVGIPPVASTSTSASHLGQCYPNPVSGTATILLNDIKGNMTIEVVDLNGKIRMSVPVHEGMTGVTIDSGSLSSGLYLVRLVSDSKVLEVKKLQVVH